MPLLVGDTIIAPNAYGRPVKIGDLPTFNLDDRDFIVTDVDGWDSVTKPDVVIVANGGGPGVVASGPWQHTERYLTVSGLCVVPFGQQNAMRRLLLDGVKPSQEQSLVVFGDGDEEPDMQAFVRLYDRPDITRNDQYMQFALPLIATDPCKYALEPLTGTMGVWTGEDWYLSMSTSSGAWYVQMDPSWSVSLVQDVPDGPYPVSLTLDSDGDTSSQRITASITGPLAAGDWYLWSETTGAQLWAEVGVTADQTLVLDSFTKTATLSGSDVSYLTYGDWLTLEPGSNSFRLVAGSDSDAFCQLSALPAYE